MVRKFSLLILLCTIVTAVMSSVMGARSNDLENVNSVNLISREKKHDQPEILKEVMEERGPNYKKYLLTDGSYKLEVHESIIHYKDESGRYQDINTNLVDESNMPDSQISISKDAAAIINKNQFMKLNKKNSSFTSFQVPFYSEIPKQIVKGYSIQSNGEKLSFIPLGASENSIGEIDSTYKSKIRYQNVWPHTDVELQILNDGIKENIILKNKNSPKSFSFEVTGNLSSNKLYIHPPWLKDAYGVTRSVEMTERTDGSKKYIDYAWNEEGLAYPVVIDPIVSPNLSSIGCVNQYYATYGCTPNLQIAYKHLLGTNRIHGNTFRSFIKFYIPNIPDAVYTDATLTLSQSLSTSFQGSLGPTITVKPYALAGEFPTNWHGANWPGPRLYESEDISSVMDVTLFNSGPSRSVQFDVSDILNYYLNKGSSSMSLALVGTDLSIPSSLPNTEYFLEFSSPKLNLVYKDLAPPTQPSNLKVTALTSNSVSLSWGASVDNSKTVYYQIIRNGSVITTYYTNSYTVSGLNENTKYTFSIRAMDSSNNLSSESNSVTITTGTHKPIANFLNLSENGIYSNPILINWSYFDPTGKKLTAYEIKGSTDNWATTEFDTGVLAVTTPVEFSTNLLPSKPWSLAIRAYNESGAGDWSYINNIRTNWNVEYIYDSAGRIDYIILSGKIKLDYEYDINGNLIRTVKTTL